MKTDSPTLHRTRTFSYWLYPSQKFWIKELVPKGEYQSRNLKFARRLMQALLRARPRTALRVADVGAHIGMNAMHYASLAARVDAYEPQPRLFELLERNLRENHIGNVSAFNFALGARDGEARFSTAKLSNDGENHVAPGGGPGEPVRLRKLDSCYRSGPRPLFIKMDVEGYELEVLRGALATIRAGRPALQLELTRPEARRYDRRAPEKIFALLKKEGYGRPLTNSGREISSYSGMPRNCTDLFWLPADAAAAL